MYTVRIYMGYLFLGHPFPHCFGLVESDIFSLFLLDGHCCLPVTIFCCSCAVCKCVMTQESTWRRLLGGRRLCVCVCVFISSLLRSLCIILTLSAFSPCLKTSNPGWLQSDDFKEWFLSVVCYEVRRSLSKQAAHFFRLAARTTRVTLCWDFSQSLCHGFSAHIYDHAPLPGTCIMHIPVTSIFAPICLGFSMLYHWMWIPHHGTRSCLHGESELLCWFILTHIGSSLSRVQLPVCYTSLRAWT